MTIYQIKALVENSSTPHFFSRKTLKFFNQTLKDFKVYKQEDGRFYITAPITDYRGRVVSHTEKYFNPITNQLEKLH